MKNYMMYSIALGILTAGATAMACPNLTGSYSCKSDNGDVSAFDIAQRVDSGITIYTISGGGSSQEIKADGTPQTSTDPKTGTQITEKFSCGGTPDALIRDVSMPNYPGVGDVTAVQTITATPAGMHQKLDVTAGRYGTQTQETDCTRK